MQLSSNLRLRCKFAVANPTARRCRAAGCTRTFKNPSGLTQHQNAHHPEYIPEPSSDESEVRSPEDDSEEVEDGEMDNERDSSGDSDQRGREDSSAQPQSSRRATVEDVDDDDDVSSTSSRDSRGKTSKLYHPTLNGVFQRSINILITELAY